jgi:hypothetical protein
MLSDPNGSRSGSEEPSRAAQEFRDAHQALVNSEEYPSADSQIVTTADSSDRSRHGDASSQGRFSPRASLFYGLTGLAGLLAVLVAAFIMAIYVLSETDLFIDDDYIMFMLQIQVVYWPPLISFIFTTSTCMFLNGRVLFRVGASLLLCLPAFALLCFGADYFLLADVEEIARDAFIVMFSGFLSIAATVLLVQAVSPWALAVDMNAPMQRLGISGLVELTMISAFALAVLMIWDLPDYLEAILVILAICIPGCLATLAMQVGILGKAKRNRTLMTMSVACLYTSILVLNGCVAYYENGETISSITELWQAILLMTAFGTVVVTAVIWPHLAWLSFCQWTCINWRSRAKRNPSSLPTATSPHPLDS